MVTLDGKNLFRITGVESFPAEKRAKKIVANITRHTEDTSFDPDDLEIRETMGIFKIYAGDMEIINVFTEDAQLQGDFTPEVIANTLFKTQIAKAVKNYRYERETSTLKKNVQKALYRTALLIVILVVLFWVFRKVDHLLEKRFKRTIEKLESKSKKIMQAQQIWAIVKVLNNILRAGVVLTIIYIFLNFVLGLFPWTRQLADTLLHFVLNPLRVIWRSFLDYLPNFFFLIMLFFVFKYGLSIGKAFFARIDRRQLRISGFEAEWAWPTYRIVRVGVILLGIVVAYLTSPGQVRRLSKVSPFW